MDGAGTETLCDGGFYFDPIGANPVERCDKVMTHAGKAGEPPFVVWVF